MVSTYKGGASTTEASSSCVYLLHFERPYRHARHYLGSTEDLEARLDAHR